MDLEVRKACAGGGMVTDKRVVEVLDDGSEEVPVKSGNTSESLNGATLTPSLISAGGEDVDMMEGVE